MAIEHQRVIEPVYIQNNESLREVVNSILSKTPRGIVLPVGRHTFSSSEEHQIAVLTVLRNGHGLLRTVGEDVDIKTACNTVTPAFMNEVGTRQIILDSVPEKPNMHKIEHILIYTPGRSPMR